MYFIDFTVIVKSFDDNFPSTLAEPCGFVRIVFSVCSLSLFLLLSPTVQAIIVCFSRRLEKNALQTIALPSCSQALTSYQHSVVQACVLEQTISRKCSRRDGSSLIIKGGYRPQESPTLAFRLKASREITTFG